MLLMLTDTTTERIVQQDPSSPVVVELALLPQLGKLRHDVVEVLFIDLRHKVGLSRQRAWANRNRQGHRSLRHERCFQPKRSILAAATPQYMKPFGSHHLYAPQREYVPKSQGARPSY